MKAVLTLEVFNGKASAARSKLAATTGKRTWVARILGFHERYGFEREFVRGYRDYSHANSVGSRGIMATYLLEDKAVYEVGCYTGWGKYDHYFCIALRGEVSRLPVEEVVEWLNARSASTS